MLEENRIQTSTCINQFWKWDPVLNLHVNFFIYKVSSYSSENLYELVWKQSTAETETVAHCGEYGIAALVQSISTPPTATLVLHMLLLKWVCRTGWISVSLEIPPSSWERFLSQLVENLLLLLELQEERYGTFLSATFAWNSIWREAKMAQIYKRWAADQQRREEPHNSALVVGGWFLCKDHHSSWPQASSWELHHAFEHG